jgi:hypothetical protein
MLNLERFAVMAAPLAVAAVVLACCAPAPSMVASAPVQNAGNPPASAATSTVCKFTNGPKAGTTHDYADETPLSIGAPCDDDGDSTGAIIPKP